MEKKIVTLAELKGEEVRLRDKMESGIDKTTETASKWLKAQRKVKELESMLLWTIITLMIFISGCQTLKGATGDSAWMLQKLSDNIKVQEK